MARNTPRSAPLRILLLIACSLLPLLELIRYSTAPVPAGPRIALASPPRADATLAPRAVVIDPPVAIPDAPATQPRTRAPEIAAPPPAALRAAPPPPAASEAAACCKLPPAYNHSVTLEWPVRLAHPVRVLMRAGNLNGRFECDVPCEYTTSASAHGGDVDVVVGEQSPPQVPQEISSKNPEVLTAARSMESAAIYTALRTLHRHVGAAMTTTLNTSAVPVTYLARSSIAKWGVAPQVFDRDRLRAHARARNATAVFVARNCASRSSREQTITKLHAKLVGGVDRPGQCMNNRPWPMCREAGKEPKKCGKHALLRNYPFYLAFENSIDVDYVSEKVFHALEAGTLPVYLGASNVKDFVPHRSVVELRDHGSAEALAAHLKSLLDDPALYDSYFEWKRRPLPDAFVSKFGFVATHAKCRLCRWAYATRHGYTWDQRRQIISDLPER